MEKMKRDVRSGKRRYMSLGISFIDLFLIQLQYPLVWINSVAGKRSFQVQHNLTRRLLIRHGLNDTPKIIDDVAEVRKFLDDF